MEFKLTYNEESQSWEPYKEPYKTIECQTKEAYQFLVDALEHYKKRGRWEESESLEDCFWVCSCCKFPSQASAAPKLYNYCPQCGAKMEVQDD